MTLSGLRRIEVVGRDRFRGCPVGRIDFVPGACEGGREGGPDDAVSSLGHPGMVLL